MSREIDTFSRRSIILKKLNFETSKSVYSLSKECKASLSTIRRDLNSLEKQGLLTRTHGGATLKTIASHQRFALRENLNKEAKIQIAHSALKFIKPNISIALNDGSTNFYFAKLLLNLKMNLTVITSGINTAIMLSENKNILCYLVGGQVKNSILATSGSYAENMIENFNLDIAFISADGFTAKHGLTFAFEGEANIAKKMIKRSKKNIALITEQKLNITENISSVPCNKIDTLITSSKSKKLLKPFYNNNIKVINKNINYKIDINKSNILKFNYVK